MTKNESATRYLLSLNLSRRYINDVPYSWAKRDPFKPWATIWVAIKSEATRFVLGGGNGGSMIQINQLEDFFEDFLSPTDVELYIFRLTFGIEWELHKALKGVKVCL